MHHTTAISRGKPCPEKAGPGRQPALDSQLPQHSQHRSSRLTPRSPWQPTGRGCSRIFPYENLPSTTNAYFVPPPFSTGGHNPREDLRPHGHTTNVTRSPVQPRSLDFVQPGVGLLSGFHLDGASVTELTVTVLAPPGGGVRGKHFDRQMKKESTLKLFISSRKTPRKVHPKIEEVLLGGTS